MYAPDPTPESECNCQLTCFGNNSKEVFCCGRGCFRCQAPKSGPCAYCW